MARVEVEGNPSMVEVEGDPGAARAEVEGDPVPSLTRTEVEGNLAALIHAQRRGDDVDQRSHFPLLLARN